MKNSLFISLCFFAHALSAQFIVIPTGTTNNVGEINKIDDFILINFPAGELAKCYGDCDNLIPLNAPGPVGYFTDNVNMLDTSTIYMLSFVGFPHHGLVYKSIDGGYNWNALLDTSDLLLTDLIAFDSSLYVTRSSYGAMRSEDDGTTWVAGINPIIYTTSNLKINDSTAIIGTNEHTSITTDRGLSWDGYGYLQSVPRAFFAKSVDSLYSIASGVTGIFFCHTFDVNNDGWTAKSIPDFDPYGLYVKNPDEVYITGKSYSTGTARIMKTTDLGDTWSFYDTGISGALSDIIFLDDSIALIGGTSGLLIKWNSNSHFEVSGTEDLDDKASFQIFPNPATNEITLSDLEGGSEILIHDVNGRIVYSGICSGSLHSIDVAEFERGIYNVQIKSENNINWRKVILN